MTETERPPEPEPTSGSDVIDAVKELTKVISDLVKQVAKLEEEWGKFRKAGRF